MTRFMLMNKDLESHVATRIVDVVDVAHAPLGLFDERGRVSKGTLPIGGVIALSPPHASTWSVCCRTSA